MTRVQQTVALLFRPKCLRKLIYITDKASRYVYLSCIPAIISDYCHVGRFQFKLVPYESSSPQAGAPGGGEEYTSEKEYWL